MNNYIISIFGNKIFFEIVNKMKLFSKFKISYYEDLDLCLKNSKNKNQIIVLFNNIPENIKISNFPLILINKSIDQTKKSFDDLKEYLEEPFTILDFEKKITSLIAKYEFRKNSLINLNNYIIDKNERKIKKII